ncbi:hypothetical protein [Moorena sp. SIO3F7]|nr:hypothetical protein [Moorena sp. SIO3F7]
MGFDGPVDLSLSPYYFSKVFMSTPGKGVMGRCCVYGFRESGVGSRE